MARMTNGARSRAAVAAASLSIGLACATKPPAPVPVERVDTIALVPLAVEIDLDDEERVRALIEPRAIAMLRERGFEVVPPEEWERRWLAIAQEIGPIWDPVTGERDDERYEAARTAIHHDLAMERGVDALGFLILLSDEIEASGPSPELCGISRDVYWPGERLARNTRVTSVHGVCLGFAIFDLDRRKLHAARHGLEWIDTYARQTHARRPLAARLRNASVIEEALAAVVGPVFKK